MYRGELVKVRRVWVTAVGSTTVPGGELMVVLDVDGGGERPDRLALDVANAKDGHHFLGEVLDALEGGAGTGPDRN